MAYNEKLADKMCVGVEKERLMLRLDPENYSALLEKDGVLPMDFAGKVMKDHVFVTMPANANLQALFI